MHSSLFQFLTTACFALVFTVLTSTPMSLDAQVKVEMTTSDGKQQSVTLLEIGNETSKLKLSGDNSNESTAFATREIQSFRLDNKQTPPGAHQVQLIDGSSLRVDEVLIDDKKVTVRRLGEKLEVSRRNVDWVAFDVSKRQAAVSKQFTELVARKLSQGDRLMVARKGKVQPLDGIVRGADADSVQFQLGERKADVKLNKLAGVKLYHAAGRELDEKLCVIKASDQSLIVARSVTTNNDNFNVELLCGDTISIPATQVINIDVGSARFAILSQMKPTSVRWKPLLASSATIEALTQLNLPRFNKAYDGQPLALVYRRELKNGLTTAREKKFSSGIAARAGSKIVFALGGGFEKLTGTVGFAPQAGIFGNLKLRIRGDGKVLFEKQLRAQDNKIDELDIDITNVDRLVIDVEYLDGRSVGDEIHFCDMKVSK